MEIVDTFEEDDIRLGISPIGILLVVLLGLVGLILFLDPNSTMYDYRIGGVIAISIPLAMIPRMGRYEGLQRWKDEGDLPKTLLLALIGASLISILVTVIYTVPVQSTLSIATILVLALPPIFEELVFRVGVFLSLQAVLGTEIATLFQAVMFALYHFIVWEVDARYALVLFIGGIVFQGIFLLSQNILSSMIAHAIVNLRPYLFAILLSPFVFLTVGMTVILILWRRSRDGE